MASDNTYSVILAEVRARMNAIADDILLQPHSLETYRKQQGRVEELALMERFILDLEQKQHTEE